jgi:hypothetical protein
MNFENLEIVCQRSASVHTQEGSNIFEMNPVEYETIEWDIVSQ